MKKYIFFDNVIVGSSHVIGNAGYVNFTQNIAPGNSSIEFYGNQSHLDNVERKIEKIEGNTVELLPIEVIVPASKKNPLKWVRSWVKKKKSDRLSIDRLMERIQKVQPVYTVFCTLIPSNLDYLYQKITAQSTQQFFLFLHGEIEYLFKEELNWKQRINKSAYLKAFASIPDNLTFLVYGDLIKDKLVEKGILPESKVIAIDHPLNYYKRTRVELPVSRPIHFAQIGRADIKKGSEKLFQLGVSCASIIKEKKAEVQLIGKVDPDLLHSKNEFVNCLDKNNIGIPQADYERYLSEADYALSFITGDEYVFRMSGSVMDAIQYQLPIVALKHEFITYLFERAGNIGFICEDIEEMSQVIRKIANKDEELISQYTEQVENLISFSEAFYSKNITKAFLKECKRVHINIEK